MGDVIQFPYSKKPNNYRGALSQLTEVYLEYAIREIFAGGDVMQAGRWHEMANNFNEMKSTG